MQPRVISATGEAITPDEITAANRVVSTRSMQAVGVYRVLDELTGVLVEFHAYKNVAYTTPGGAVDYVAVRMPNPVPYRWMSIGVVPDIPIPPLRITGTTYVMASDGEILASEVQSEESPSDGNDLLYEAGAVHYGQNAAGYPLDRNRLFLFDRQRNSWWFGTELGSVAGTSVEPANPSLVVTPVWMFRYDFGTSQGVFDHLLAVNVPEDCIGPIPPDESNVPIYPNEDKSLAPAWESAWVSSLSATKNRRATWFKKNSDETIAALKAGFTAGAQGVTRPELQAGITSVWDINLKGSVDSAYTSTALNDGSIAGTHTRMPIILSATYADSIASDTSAGLTQAGTLVTQRYTTLEYVDSEGLTRTGVVIGYLTQTVTQHTLSGADVGLSQTDTYLAWYSDQVDGNEVAYQFILDGDSVGVGLIWDGVIQSGYNATSKYGSPGNPLPYAGYEPAYPAYSNTLVGTAAPLYLQYHNEFKPEYVSDTAQSSTEMNNSALYGVTKIELSPIGCVTTESLGMFAHPDETSNASTQIELYGTAVYDFDWATGALTFNQWKPLHDAGGNEITSKMIDLPAGETWGSLGTNCLITYRGLHWPDVKEYVKLRNTDMKTGTFDFVTPGFKALVDAVKAG